MEIWLQEQSQSSLLRQLTFNRVFFVKSVKAKLQARRRVEKEAYSSRIENRHSDWICASTMRKTEGEDRVRCGEKGPHRRRTGRMRWARDNKGEDFFDSNRSTAAR